MSKKIGLVVGATGISGLNLATHLAQKEDWTIYGLARNPVEPEGVQPIAADLLNPAALKAAVQGLGVTHAFFERATTSFTDLFTQLRRENIIP